MAIKGRTWVQLVALVFLLGIFPAASWYYLNSGLQYRKAAMSDLKEYGRFPLEGWTQLDGTPLAPAFLEKKMILANLVSASETIRYDEQLSAQLAALHEQFDERDDLLFLTLVVGDKEHLSGHPESLQAQYPIADEKQQVFAVCGTEQQARLHEQVFSHIAERSVGEGADDHYFLLTDTSAMVRRAYDLGQDGDIKRLVEHIALLLPLKKDRDLIFRREVEK